jgi:predicted phosphodiesterase
MRLGLLADIHGDVNNLSRAIERLRQHDVDEFVLLGDVIYDTRDADETVQLLQACGAVGVWGNHELGLCVDPEDEVRQMVSDTVMHYFSKLQPSLEFGDVMVSHTFPTEDARDVLSYYVGEPDDEELLALCFETKPHRIMICGHFHRWFAATPFGRLNWNGQRTLQIDPNERYFIIIDAVMGGFAAVLDDDRNLLIPIELAASGNE